MNVVPRGGVKPRLSDRPAARSRTRLALVALAAAFALKLAVMLQLKDHVLTQPDAGLDTTAYVALAERVLGGDLGTRPRVVFSVAALTRFAAFGQ